MEPCSVCRWFIRDRCDDAARMTQAGRADARPSRVLPMAFGFRIASVAFFRRLELRQFLFVLI